MLFVLCISCVLKLQMNLKTNIWKSRFTLLIIKLKLFWVCKIILIIQYKYILNFNITYARISKHRKITNKNKGEKLSVILKNKRDRRPNLIGYKIFLMRCNKHFLFFFSGKLTPWSLDAFTALTSVSIIRYFL